MGRVSNSTLLPVNRYFLWIDWRDFLWLYLSQVRVLYMQLYYAFSFSYSAWAMNILRHREPTKIVFSPIWRVMKEITQQTLSMICVEINLKNSIQQNAFFTVNCWLDSTIHCGRLYQRWSYHQAESAACFTKKLSVAQWTRNCKAEYTITPSGILSPLRLTRRAGSGYLAAATQNLESCWTISVQTRFINWSCLMRYSTAAQWCADEIPWWNWPLRAGKSVVCGAG